MRLEYLADLVAPVSHVVLPGSTFSPHFADEEPEAREQWPPSPYLCLQRMEEWNSCQKIQM